VSTKSTEWLQVSLLGLHVLYLPPHLLAPQTTINSSCLSCASKAHHIIE
jgi:hypothetical protein